MAQLREALADPSIDLDARSPGATRPARIRLG